MSRPLSDKQVWATPVVLGVLSAVGLVAALVADGAGDALSWVALSVPAVVCAWGLWRPRPPAPPPAPPHSPDRRAARPARLPGSSR